MPIPPGPAYLLNIFPYYAPCAIFYLGFRILESYGKAPQGVPTWLVVIVAFIARPLFSLCRIYWNDFLNARAAAKQGAILPPTVQESTVSLLKDMSDTTKHGYPGRQTLGFSKKYGNAFQIKMTPLPAVFMTIEPEHVKAMLATQFESFPKGSLVIDQMKSLLGSGVFNSDGDMWKFHRSITRPFFVRERISNFEIYERNADHALTLAKERLAQGISVDIQDLTARFTLDSATEFLFGAKVDSLSAGLPFPQPLESLNTKSFYEHRSTPFVKAFGEAQLHCLLRTNYGPAWPLWEFWRDEVKPLRKVVDDFVTPFVTSALQRHEHVLSTGAKPTQEESNVLASLVKDTQDAGIIKDEVLNLLVAGRDTTSALLTFCFYILSQRPDIENRLREEILQYVGPTDPPDYNHMRDMKYMRAFLNEVLRMYPPVPVDSRQCNKAVVLPATTSGLKPIYLPANTTCAYSILNIHRRKDLWGPDALKFDPDRFLDSRLHKYLVPNPFIFCPFNAGPRICLGQQFAYHEATYFLVRVLQQFTGFKLDDSLNAVPPADWQTGDECMQNERIHPQTHLTMYVEGGLWMQMEELKRSTLG